MLRTTPATTVTPPAVPVWDPWPQTASAASNRRKLFFRNRVTFSTASAQLGVPRAASWMTCRHAESVIPPAGSVLGHLQTTVRPVPPRPACTRAAVSPHAHKASLFRTTNAKRAIPPARPAPVPPRPTASPAPSWCPCRVATAGQTAKRGISLMLSLESASSAARTASAAQQTSRRASAASVCGAKRQECGCWAITVSLAVLWVIMAGMEPASNAIHHVRPAVGLVRSLVLPALPTAFSCHLDSVPPNVPLDTITMGKGSARHATASA